jgi:hypothetical protein
MQQKQFGNYSVPLLNLLSISLQAILKILLNMLVGLNLRFQRRAERLFSLVHANDTNQLVVQPTHRLLINQ